MENIHVPVSPGEVLDKITILEIKSQRMSDPEKVANGKSIVSMMLLQAACGTSIEVSIDGDDEHEAMIAIEALVSSGFGEVE